SEARRSFLPAPGGASAARVADRSPERAAGTTRTAAPLPVRAHLDGDAVLGFLLRMRIRLTPSSFLANVAMRTGSSHSTVRFGDPQKSRNSRAFLHQRSSR